MLDEPLQGVPIEPSFGDTLYTDEAGEITFTRFDFTEDLTAPLLGRTIVLDGALTIVRMADLLPVEARFVDLDTGAPLEVTWPDESGGAARAG